ncbi:uncharacterized protein N0V89_003183 [Didymosphaeria variabile]|uniref:Alpha/beta-hydrolase n=1 Tax=Didymosphaeria variabile TaxID=1932322 RepID=A0A9W9CF88_9PLEO|nr:uncharacterized protein N0V89_003183 [Didymosphaeria variabile]KAJ4358599.1 hypothetical protein N0V89_003183 [Didymosphaeria variabile]
MPTEPRWSCTIPSLHDDTPLDVRIYHPSALESAKEKPWKKRGIVMAHPYAPMGGSYDDRVVGIVVEEFLAAGWVVGTFNFRGTHGAKGHTSWSGKPELSDYHSFAGFFMHYLSYLRPNPPSDAAFTPEQSPVSPITARKNTDDEAAIVVLGGYSYGSIILRHLPPLPSVLQPFAAPITGSAAHEILLCAEKISAQANLEFINIARDHERLSRRGHEHKLSVKMGGEETSLENRRSSREIRRSVDGGKSLDIASRLRSLSHSHQRRKDTAPQPPAEAGRRPAIQIPEVRYLLVSPLTPPTSTLAAPGLARGFWNRSGDEDVTLKRHETLAVFGDQDMFASARKMKEWAARLNKDNNVGFHSVEVEGAGHFWHEPGVEQQLREALQLWEKRVKD